MNDDTFHRIAHVNRTHEIEEPIFRDWLNGIYLQDVQSSQLEILTGAIERAFQAQLDGTLAQSHVDDVINSRKALKKPNLTEKSLESEARYFRHCLMINFVIGLGPGIKHHFLHEYEPFNNNPYTHAVAVADYVLPMYYDIDTQIVAILPTPSTTVTFLDPSATMTNKLIQQRKVVTGKAALAVRTWAGQANINSYFVDQGPSEGGWLPLHEYGILTDAGKANLRAAIETADPTRVETENDNE